MDLLKLAPLSLILLSCTFNPEYEVSSIVCVAGDDNTCPSGFTCTLTEASPEGLCCKGSKGACTEEPPALAAKGGRGQGDDGGSDSAGPASPDTSAAPGSDGGGGTAGRDAAGSTGGADAGLLDTSPRPGDAVGIDDAATDTRMPDASTDAAPTSPDLPATPMCVPACTLGDRRCGPSGGLRTCVLVDGCPAWGVEMACGSGPRRVCVGAEPAARCECMPAPTGCNGQAGAYCSSASTLETCVADSDGCIHRGTTTTCPAGKPCTGTLPSASCSCGAAPAACMGTSGNICTGPSTLITCGASSEGCPAITAMRTCGASETCQGAAGSATCQCNPPPAACAGTASGTVCSGQSVVMCGMTAGGCGTASTVKTCTADKPCGVVNGAADCRCASAAPACAGVTGTVCSGSTVLSCGTNSEGCATSSVVMTCPAGKPCAGPAGTAACTCGPVAAECTGIDSGTVCQGTGTVLTCGTNADGCPTSAVAKSCSGGRQCSGAPAADCHCVNEPSQTDCPAGMEGSRCVGNQVYTCGTSSDGCRTLTKTTCPASGACLGTLPIAMCVSEQTFGNATDLGGTDVSHGANTFWGVKMEVTQKIWLKRFGLIARNGPGRMRLVLYSDNGLAGMASAPASYLAGAFDYTVVAGKQEYAVNNVQGAPGNTPVVLEPGWYWMLAVFENSTTIAHGAGNPLARYKTLMAPVYWNNTPPNPFGTSYVDDTATAANYYLVGLPQ